MDSRVSDFIKMASAVLGTTEEVAREATLATLELIAKAAPAADVQALLSKLPGAGDLLKAFATAPEPPTPPPPGSTAAIMNAISDVIASAATTLQGAVGTGSALLNLLGQVGLDPRRATRFLGLFVDFARQQAGPEVVDRVINAVPGARQVLTALGAQGRQA